MEITSKQKPLKTNSVSGIYDILKIAKREKEMSKSLLPNIPDDIFQEKDIPQNEKIIGVPK